jgi:hypothetical protein
MKRCLCFLALISGTVFAQSSHSVLLTWTASTDTGGTVNVYKATSACTGTPSFTLLASGVVAGGPYTDASVGIGKFCYYVTAVVNGAESLPSNFAPMTVLPKSPTAVTAVSQ